MNITEFALDELEFATESDLKNLVEYGFRLDEFNLTEEEFDYFNMLEREFIEIAEEKLRSKIVVV